MRNNLLLSLLLTTIIFSVRAQDSSIKGKVIGDKDGLGIPFVNVFGKGTTIGTTTDFDGNYQLNLPENIDTLVFSFIGYKTAEVPIAGRSVIDIPLSEDVQALEEVVIVGYGTLKKEDITSSIAVVDATDLQGSPNASFESALQGRASGVLIQNASGKLGEGIKVRVRGASSLSGPNQPLYVIDGIPLNSGGRGSGSNQPTNPMADINPNDIASISLLKDASATAIYGSRAANGVILITTKKGKSGRPKFNIDYQFGVSQTPRKIDLLNAKDYKRLQVENSIRQLEGSIVGILVSHITDDLDIETLDQILEEGSFELRLGNTPQDTIFLPSGLTDNDLETDWQDEIFRTAISHQANLSVSGGKEKSQYYGSLSYLDQEGILVGNQYQRITGRLTYNTEVSDKLKLTFGVTGSSSTNDRLNEDADTGSPIQAISLPSADGYDPTTLSLINFSNENIYYNPLKEIAFSNNDTKIFRGIGNFALDYKLTQDVKFTTEFGVDITDEVNSQLQGNETFDGSGFPSGLKRVTERDVFNYSSNSYFTFDKILDDHTFNAVLGASYQKSKTQGSFLRDVVLIPFDDDTYAFLAYVFRLNYSFKNKYLVQLSGRSDGSSKFGSNNRIGYFPSISLGWNIDKEDFLQGTSISSLKLKASYGVIGNAPNENNLTYQAYERANYGNYTGRYPINLPNPDLKWESTAQLNIGLEFGLWNERLSAQIDYFDKTTSDLLFPRALSSASGYSFILDNIGELKNSGIEFAITADIVDKTNFSWQSSFNITRSRNEVTKLEVSEIVQGVNAAKPGETLGFFYLRKFTGVDPETGSALYDNGEGGTTDDFESAPKFAMGSANPDFFGGFSNKFTYRDFDLSFLIQFFIGNEIYNRTGEEISNSGSGLLLNQTADQANRWLKPGDVTDVPVLNPNETVAQSSSRYLEDGSYYRLRNITLGYNLPSENLENISLSTLRVFISAQNLLTKTDYSGYDPEINFNDARGGNIASNLTQGVDFYSTPTPKVFLVGIKVGF